MFAAFCSICSDAVTFFVARKRGAKARGRARRAARDDAATLWTSIGLSTLNQPSKDTHTHTQTLRLESNCL